MAPASKTYAPGGTSAWQNAKSVHRIAGHDAQEHSHAGHSHGGARLRLLRGRHWLRLRLRTAVTEQDHDLRLFTRRPRLARPAVLPDLRFAAAGALLSAMMTLAEVVLAFVVTSALLLALVHLLLPAKKKS